jgi:hypothetical protein
LMAESGVDLRCGNRGRRRGGALPLIGSLRRSRSPARRSRHRSRALGLSLVGRRDHDGLRMVPALLLLRQVAGLKSGERGTRRAASTRSCRLRGRAACACWSARRSSSAPSRG